MSKFSLFIGIGSRGKEGCKALARFVTWHDCLATLSRKSRPPYKEPRPPYKESRPPSQ